MKVIFVSLLATYVVYMTFYIIPMGSLTPQQGSDFIAVLSYPFHWIIPILIFLSGVVQPLYRISQQPLLQKINLPEAQSRIFALNEWLEFLSSGIGISVGGIVLASFRNNFLATALVLGAFGMVGAFMWLPVLRWIERDADTISSILKTRAGELATRVPTDKE